MCWKTLILLWCSRSCTSTLLHIRESTIWIAKTSPHTSLPFWGFFWEGEGCIFFPLWSCYVNVFTADLSKTLSCAVTTRCSFSLPRSYRHGRQTRHAALESLSVLHFTFHVRHAFQPTGDGSQWGSEFKAIILSAWKSSLHFAWKLCPVYFHFLSFCLCFLSCFVLTMQSGPYVKNISTVCPG